MKFVQTNNMPVFSNKNRFIFTCRILALLITIIIASTIVLTGCGRSTEINDTSNGENKAWHLIEVQMWDNLQTITAPYNIVWMGREGDITSAINVDWPYAAVSSINTTWTLPPEKLIPGSEYQMDFSITAVIQNMGLLVEEGGEEFMDLSVVEKVLTSLEGVVTAGLDEYNILPDESTRSRISIIPEDNYPRIRWNDTDGTVKSGKFTFKIPEYGFANSRNTNKLTLTVKYQHIGILAWRYIYEWTDKDITPIRMGTTTITP